MSIIEKTLSNIDGGRVLDIATQDGHFTQVLKKYLKTYSEIVGIDINKDSIESANTAYGCSNIRFIVMDAERLAFKDACFDTVAISASLHHLSNIPVVLNEMIRVLKPGGQFILIEMHRDGHSEAALTSVYLHHWVAAVDSALGQFHNKTLPLQDFKDHITSLGLSDVAIHDASQLDSNPFEPTRIEQLNKLVDDMLQRAKGAHNISELEERGEHLRKRLHTIGAEKEPIILIVGIK